MASFWRGGNALLVLNISVVCVTNGSPRMLLLIVLVREFESRRGEILNSFAKKKKKKKDQQLLRAPINSVGEHNSTRVDEGRKS